MKQPTDAEEAALRKRAEARLTSATRANPARRTSPPPVEGKRLEHELTVHQVELEMQNEELRAAHASTEAARRRYEELFQFAPVGYAVLDLSGTIHEANYEISHMLDVPAGAVVGRQLASFVEERDRASLAEFLTAVVESAGPGQPGASLEVALAQDGGGTLQARLVAVARTGSRPAGLLVAIEDVTELRRTERQLRQECARRDEFMAALSHELRNPLSPICNGLSLLTHVTAQKSEARRLVDIVSRQADHLVHIIDDLLDVTRIAQGKIVLRRELLELAGLVQRTVADYRLAFKAAGVRIDCHLTAEPVWVDVDVTRVAQVIGNLLTNALKFTPRDGRVVVSLQRNARMGILSVRDDGSGIAPDVIEHVFEAFTQAPQTLDRARGGLGLGLAMVKGLVELHGGTVHVASAGPGNGSEFTLEFPLAPAPRAAKATEKGRAPEPVRGHQRVLVVDDYLDSADVLRELLEVEGHTARVAADGPSAISLARAFHPQVIICDIGLPGMDGYEVARTMRSDPLLRDAYLVAVSGYARPEDCQRSAEAGFDLHLAKPVSTQAIARLMRECRRVTL
jgi:two-component system CheB/CheR fusion protein